MGAISDVPAGLSAALADRYRIERQLGQGGMATVYLAEDLRHRRQVAVKVLRPELAAAIGPERFLREIEIAAGLSHPHILPLFDSGRTGGRADGRSDEFLYYVMPFLEGESLADRLRRERQLPIPEAVQITREVADALGYAHSRGVVHRDIKPDNILLQSGHAVVADFGIAWAVGAAGGEKLTETGLAIGTPSYMSPEQSVGDTVDARSDIYALGSVLYEMLAGEPPYTGPTPQAVIGKRLADAIPDVRVLRETVPAHVHQALTAALAKAPADRFSTAGQFAEALTMDRGAGVAAAPPAPGHRPKHNLPLAADSFVGREAEITDLRAALGHSRLVTLTGVGGTGKTRLALTVGERLLESFTDGVWLAELASVLEAGSVPYVIADAIGARQVAGKSLVESIVQSLELRSLLLILDNCEHQLDTVAEVVEAVVTRCPDVRIVATSREGLAVPGEHVIRLQSLPKGDGVALFRDRAAATAHVGVLDGSAIGRIVERLDGIPLAIELAAARCGSMALDQIENRLDDRFRLLRGSGRGRTERHQTLRSTVAWSYELLEPTQQRVFNRLSVFSGGLQLEAAVVVARDDAIDELDVEDAVAALVERSMVIAEPTVDGTRYRLLETLRQFGEEQLVASGESDRTQDAHLAWFHDFVRRAVDGQASPDDEPWWRALLWEFENLRLATFRAIERGDQSAVSAILEAIWGTVAVYWYRLEVADWAAAALAMDHEPPLARAVAAAWFTMVGRFDEAAALARWDDPPAEADENLAGHWHTAHYAYQLFRGEVTEAGRAYEKAVPLLDHEAGLYLFLRMHTSWLVMLGRIEEARRRAAANLEWAEGYGNTLARAMGHFFMGRAIVDAEPAAALHHFDRSIEFSARIGERFFRASAASEAAAAAVRVATPKEACDRVAFAVRQFIDSGDLASLWTSAHHLALFLAHTDRLTDARTVWGELRDRHAFAAPYHREELAKLLGAPGESTMTDRAFTKYLKRLVEELDAASERTAS